MRMCHHEGILCDISSLLCIKRVVCGWTLYWSRDSRTFLRHVGVKLAWRNGKQFSPGPVFSAKKQRQGVVFCCGGGVTSPGPSVPSGLPVRGR